jgi:opacity protein-like surface antigen
MKKIALATLLAVAAIATSAQAVEVGVVGGTDFLNGGPNHGTAGVTIGQHFGDFSVTAEGLREIKGNTDKYNLLAGYDFAKVGSATLTAKLGAGYVDNSTITDHGNRFVGLVGAGVSIPVTKAVSATVDYRYQATKDAADKFQGNTVLVGARYSF